MQVRVLPGSCFACFQHILSFPFTDLNPKPLVQWAGACRCLCAAAAHTLLLLAGNTCAYVAVARVPSRSPRGPPARRGQSRRQFHRSWQGHSRCGEAWPHQSGPLILRCTSCCPESGAAAGRLPAQLLFRSAATRLESGNRSTQLARGHAPRSFGKTLREKQQGFSWKAGAEWVPKDALFN